MYPADRAANDPHLPFSPGYGLAWVLARKVAELPDAGPFAAGAPGLAELSRRYPAPS
jgi:hypothetical protein